MEKFPSCSWFVVASAAIASLLQVVDDSALKSKESSCGRLFCLASFNLNLAFFFLKCKLIFNTIIFVRYNALQLRKIESNDILYNLKSFSTSLST